MVISETHVIEIHPLTEGLHRRASDWWRGQGKGDHDRWP